jgi:stress-induced morphogen
MSAGRVLLGQIRSASNRFLFPRHSCLRLYSGPAQSQGGGEAHLASLLRKRFPGATEVQVADVSGGCGSMYEVFIEAPEFEGLRMVQQHKLVTEALKEEIKAMHGLRISTAVTKTG